MLRVAALLWRGGGEADGVLAAQYALQACDKLREGLGKTTVHEQMLALADGLHVRCVLAVLCLTSHVTPHTSHVRQVLGLSQDAANQRADSEDTLVECVRIR